jgi:menaquinone-9 beta-reductase
METGQQYQVAITGGGLAGLAAAIELRRSGHSVILFEKEKYPFHKVCGEYVSMESWKYLTSLGLPLHEMNLPLINRFDLTSPNGKLFSTKLESGGFGISRWLMDASLAKIAKNEGVQLMEECRVEDVTFLNDLFIVTGSSAAGKFSITSELCFSAYGKRSNLDVKWKRNFLRGIDKQLDNYVAVKYHVLIDWDDGKIALHNFRNGYCGISKIEEGKCCVCYMVKAEELKQSNNSITAMQNNVLAQNPRLEKIFSESTVLPGFPVTISQVNFNKKTTVENHVIMIGDAAGMITPLCGNGMSIALHTAKIASQLANRFLRSEMTRTEMEKNYKEVWDKNFSGRLKTGRLLQNLFGNTAISNRFVRLIKVLPFLAKPLIRMTHGKSF